MSIDMFHSYYLSYLYGKVRSVLHYYISGYIWHHEDISEILPSIFISDIGTAYNQIVLDAIGITHIINAVLAVDPAYPEKYGYLSVNLRDVSDEDILAEFDNVNAFMDTSLENGGKVLVHCICGVSRSATLVAAYLINKKELSYTQAMNLLMSKRAKIDPNTGFREQLRKYAKTFDRDDSETIDVVVI